MNETHNPYAPPRAFVDDPSDDELEVQALIENGRTVPIGRCGLWISASFRQFFQRPWKWIGTLFLLFVISGVISLIPYTNIVNGILWPIVTGGIAYALDEQRRTRTFSLGNVFAGFNRALVPLAVIGAVGTLSYIVMFAVFFVMVGREAATDVVFGTRTMQGIPPNFWSALMVSIIAGLPISAATYFAAPLIMLHGVAPVRALRMSMFGFLRNIVPLILFGVLMLVIITLSMLPLLLGLFVTLPTIGLAFYPIYRDIFVEGAGPEVVAR